MPAIRISEFGGLFPLRQERAQPLGNATVANNIDLRFGDFRPLPEDGAPVTAVAAATKSLFKTPDGQWLSSTNIVDYVRGPVNATVERIYLTNRGSYPEVYSGGTYRQLGVPKPDVAPVVVVNAVDEYTKEEDDAGRARIPEEMYNALMASIEWSAAGNAPGVSASPTQPGWVAHGVAGMPSSSASEWNFLAPMTGPSGSLVYPERTSFLLDNRFGGKEVTYGLNTYWAVPVRLHGNQYTINKPALAAALGNIKSPVDGTSPLATSAQISPLVDRVASDFDPTLPPVKELVDAINAAQVRLFNAADQYVNSLIQKNTVTDFYSKADVAAAINAAIVAFGDELVHVENILTEGMKYAPLSPYSAP